MLILMLERIVFVTMCCIVIADLCITMSVNDFDTITKFKERENRTAQHCEPLPLKVLIKLHGPAFNPRYMSVRKPLDKKDNLMEPNDAIDRKRNTNSRPAFYITEDNVHALSEEPAWNIKWDSFREEEFGNYDHMRKKRDLVAESRCEKEVKWISLGFDYHPSYLRTIECTKPKCYYGMFDCKPKKFEVRILQRRRGICADAASLKHYGFIGEHAEVWEWITYPLNFCCDCVSTKRYF